MDVHKNFLVACIAVTDEHSRTEHHIRRFSTFTGDLRKLAAWLASYNCRDVCMESCGKYWIPVFNALEKADINVCLTHPKYVKAIKERKPTRRTRSGLPNCSSAIWCAQLYSTA